MCGIVCSIGYDVAHELPCRLWHRGPDGNGRDDADVGWSNAHVCQYRLAIVDQGTIRIPYGRSILGISLAYNGEIYNWRSLRSELSDGTPWETNCDTEVVARAWRRWGPDMLGRFNGMFALVLVDEEEKIVFLARDRAGEKPLFYAKTQDGLCVASEIKALPIAFEEQPCAEMSALEFDCLEETPFKGVRRLPPGSYILLKSKEDLANPKVQTWWKLPTEIDEGMTWETAVDETEALVRDAVRIRVPDEVKGAILLSGGLDSAIVQAIAKFPQAYCCTFPEDGIDCMTLAQAAACGAEVVPVTFGLADVQRDMERIAWHLDTPATWTALAQWFLARQIHEAKYKVVLSGEGADELFGGYSRYRILWHLDQMRRDTNLARYAPLMDTLFDDSDGFLARMLDRSPNSEARAHALTLVRRYGGAGGMAARMARVEWHTTMQLLLRMADRMFAASSIENRSPFLDYRIIELATRMPARHKITAAESKAVLREVARRLGIDRRIIDDTNKRGLVVPWNKWTASSGTRGTWDRRNFADAMLSAWRSAYDLDKA